MAACSRASVYAGATNADYLERTLIVRLRVRPDDIHEAEKMEKAEKPTDNPKLVFNAIGLLY
jgi:hypothetical protein